MNVPSALMAYLKKAGGMGKHGVETMGRVAKEYPKTTGAAALGAGGMAMMDEEESELEKILRMIREGIE